jgi:hypothetical protein
MDDREPSLPPVPDRHRRELYSPASPGAGELPDVVGPDGVRVSLRVEPAIDRLKRLRYLFFTPPVVTDPVRAYVGYRHVPGWVQRVLLKDRWSVQIEADNGDRRRLVAPDYRAAVDEARRVREGIARDGVAYLRTLSS